MGKLAVQLERQHVAVMESLERVEAAQRLLIWDFAAALSVIAGVADFILAVSH
jgi:hypothetical protein